MSAYDSLIWMILGFENLKFVALFGLSIIGDIIKGTGYLFTIKLPSPLAPVDLRLL